MNGKSLTCLMLKQVFPRASLDPLLFLIYINDLSEGSSKNELLFSDDNFLFFLILDRNTSALELNNDGRFSGK